MRTLCHRMISVAGLIVALSLSAVAQTDTNEGTDESELLDRVRRLEERQEQRLEREILAIKAEINKLEQSAAKKATSGGEAYQKLATPVAASDNRWRFKYHEGRWWYWMPDEQWVYWSSNRWLRLPYSTPAAQSVVVRAAEPSEEAKPSQTSDISKGDRANRNASEQGAKAAASTSSSQPASAAKRRDSSEPSERRPAEKNDGATRVR